MIYQYQQDTQKDFGLVNPINIIYDTHWCDRLKGWRMGRSDKVSVWYMALLINTRFRFFFLF